MSEEELERLNYLANRKFWASFHLGFPYLTIAQEKELKELLKKEKESLKLS